MAITPSNSPPAPADPRDAAFLREVDEEVQREAQLRLLRRWGKPALILLGLGLVILAGALFWRAQRERATQASSEQLIQALNRIDAGSLAEAQAGLDAVAQSSIAGQRALALLAQAGLAADAANTARATALLTKVADDDKAPDALRDTARIKLVRLKFDSLPTADILRQLQPYLEGDSPWFAIAGEMAALAHLRDHAPDRAGPLFARIAADPRAPVSIRTRCEQMAASLGHAVGDKAPPPAATPARQ